jgi:hypothetical protein
MTSHYTSTNHQMDISRGNRIPDKTELFKDFVLLNGSTTGESNAQLILVNLAYYKQEVWRSMQEGKKRCEKPMYTSRRLGEG